MMVSVLVVDEFAAVSADYVILFAKDSQTGAFRAVALLGLNKGQNAYCSETGWNATYVPLNISRFPFSVSDPDQSEAPVVSIDEGSSLVNETQGEALFDEFGFESEFLQSVRKRLNFLYESEARTRDFFEILSEYNLLKLCEIVIAHSDGSESTLDGLYSINDRVMANLGPKEICRLHDERFLGPIYHALGSRAQLRRLNQIYNSRDFLGGHIRSVNLRAKPQ